MVTHTAGSASSKARTRSRETPPTDSNTPGGSSPAPANARYSRFMPRTRSAKPASSRRSRPDAISAPFSPVLWPSSASGRTPNWRSSASTARPATNTDSDPSSMPASRASTRACCSAFKPVGGGKMASPGAMSRVSQNRPSRKSNQRRAAGKCSASALSMFGYWEFSPGNRKASLPSSGSVPR